MSGSRRKTSVIGCCGARSSEKSDKRLNNRRLRRANKDPEKEPKKMREVSDVWNMGKDGKMFFDKYKQPEYMRK